MNKVNLAVVGATGMVGRMFLKVLEERKFPINDFFPIASSKSAGSKISFMNNEYTVEELTKDSFNKKIDIALFSAGGNVSREYAPIAVQNGCIVVDNSSSWRMDTKVPLIVPEVNCDAVKNNKGIIANPNCSTIQSVMALNPLHRKYKIKRIVYTTFQSVSGAGMSGFLDLENGLKGESPKKFPYPIANNCIPHIDAFLENGYTKEEQKMIDETQKILDDYQIKITATTVRVPVYYGHGVSINVEFEKDFDLHELRNLLANSPGIVVEDDPSNSIYPMQINAAGHDEVFVGRIRRDFSVQSGVNLWVVADNVRKGAATNAVQIAELLLTDGTS